VNFLLSYAGKFDMYVEDECAAYVRYCFKDPVDAAIFRSRFEQKSEPFRLAGRAPPTAAVVCRTLAQASQPARAVAHCRPIEGCLHGLADKMRPSN
jgi:hypothetical protein